MEGHQFKPWPGTRNHGAHDRLVYTAVPKAFPGLMCRWREEARLRTWVKGYDLGSDPGRSALGQGVVGTLACLLLPFPGIKLGGRVVGKKGTSNTNMGHCGAL